MTVSRKKIHVESFTAQSIANQLEHIAQLIDGGQIKIYVEQVFPLEKARRHRSSAKRAYQREIVLEVVSG